MTIAASRRRVLALGLAAPLMLLCRRAGATPEAMAAAIEAFTGGGTPAESGITLDIPLLVENGNSVPITVSVESAMTEEDHVEEIAVFNEANPLPDVVRVRLTPRSSLGRFQTRIRLAGSQTIVAVARMSDGSLRRAAVSVIVTAPACRES